MSTSLIVLKIHVMDRTNLRYSEKMLISIHIEEDLNYWANKWGVSRESIKSAVKASRSNNISSVKEYLLKNQQISKIAD